MIVALVFAGLFALFVIIFLIYHFLMPHAQSFNHQHGMKIFELDANNRKIRIIPNNSTRYAIKGFYKGDKFGGWEQLPKLTNSFKDTEGEKKFRDVLHKLTKNDFAPTEINFKTPIRVNFFKKAFLNFNLTFSKNEGDTISNLIIKYDTTFVHEHKEKTKEIYIHSNQEIIKIHSSYLAFVSFVVKTDRVDPNTFSGELCKIYGDAAIMHISNNIVTVIEKAKSAKAAKKTLEKMENIFVKRGLKYGLQLSVLASAKIYSKDVNNLRRLNTVLKSQDYFLNVSHASKNNFVSIESPLYKKDEFKSFINGSREFRVALKSNNITPSFFSVRKKSTNRKVIEYLTPTIESIPKSTLDLILRNQRSQKSLTDVTAKLFSTKKMDKNILLDVNEEWFFSHIEKIKNKRAIYVINTSTKTNVEDFIFNVKVAIEAGIEVALRINKINSDIKSKLKGVNLRFIVIDELFASNISNTNIFVRLSSIVDLATKKKINMIYENPAELSDKLREKKIRIQYFYKK